MFDEDMAREHKNKDRAGRMQAARSAYIAGLIDFNKTRGRAVYPDANGSLRLTWGKVTGRTRDALSEAQRSKYARILEKFTGRDPFESPAKQLNLIRAKDYGPYKAPALGTLPVNFLSTVDITGGNSGSATLNAKGELVELAFDGTIEGVISDWWFDETLTRTIHVDSRYMLWVMDKVDGAQRLLDEMKTGK